MNGENNGVAMTSHITPWFSYTPRQDTDIVRRMKVAMTVVMTSRITPLFSGIQKRAHEW